MELLDLHRYDRPAEDPHFIDGAIAQSAVTESLAKVDLAGVCRILRQLVAQHFDIGLVAVQEDPQAGSTGGAIVRNSYMRPLVHRYPGQCAHGNAVARPFTV